MVKEFDINCLIADPVSPTLVHKVLYILVANGARYNEGKYPGSYRIFVDDGEDKSAMETADRETIERLPDIVDEYSTKDLESDWLQIQFSEYLLGIRPYGKKQTVVSFATSASECKSSEEFLQLAGVVEDLCCRLQVTYAEYSGEYDRVQYSSIDDLSPEHLRTITYFNSDLADALGRERLLSLPVHDVRVHDDGGVFIVVSPDPEGGYEDVQAAREQLKEPDS